MLFGTIITPDAETAGESASQEEMENVLSTYFTGGQSTSNMIKRGGTNQVPSTTSI